MHSSASNDNHTGAGRKKKKEHILKHSKYFFSMQEQLYLAIRVITLCQFLHSFRAAMYSGSSLLSASLR